MAARRPSLALAAVAALVLGRPARAEVLPGYSLDGSVTAGYRHVDVGGSEDKFREDYNLRSGGRLFNLDVAGASKTPDTSHLDRFHLEVDTPGDEPVSRFRLTAADRQLYDLRVNFIRSKYFYNVPQEFEAPVPGDNRIDDLHSFDFVRTNGSADLTVHAPHLPTLLFGYRLYRRDGNGVSTVTQPGSDNTWLVHAPVDDVTHVGRLGTEFRALDTDFFLQQEFRRVDRRITFDDVRNPLGVDPTDGTTLNFFDSSGDETLNIPATTVRLRRPIGEIADLTGAYFYSHADLSADRQRLAFGTPTPAYPATRRANDRADATLDTHVADLGTDVQLTDHLSAHGAYRYNERTQDGDLSETGTLGFLAARTGDQTRRHSVTGDLEYEPCAKLNLRAGMHWARRTDNFSQSGQDISTDTIGAIGGARYRPWTFLDLYARYENVQIEDPFLVPGDPTSAPPLPERQIELTFVNRATGGLRLTPRDWLSLSYQLTADSRENDSFDASAQAYGNTVAFTIEPVTGLTFFTSYTRRDLENRADILTAPLYLGDTSVQQGSEDVLVSTLQYDFGLLGQRWTTGWDVAFANANNVLEPRLETGGGSKTVFDLNRIDAGAFLTFHNKVLEPTVEVRRIDYNQRVLSLNDYDATIVLIKLTRRFDF
jgi:hypothetical protein